MKSFLTTIQKTELKTLHKSCKERRFADRLKAILLLDKGYSCAEVAELLLIDDDTIRTYSKTYFNQGIRYG